MTIIEQIMKLPKDTLLTSDTIEHGIETVLSRSLTSCAVTTAAGEFLGQITDASLVQAVILKTSGKKITLMNDIRNLYLRPVIISKTATMSQLVSKIFKAPSQRVFIVDANHKLLGLISAKDLLTFLINELAFKMDQEQHPALEKIFLKDEENLKSLVKAKDSSKDILVQLFENSPSFFMTFGDQFKLTYANKTARSAMGLSESKSGKNSLSSFFLPYSLRQIQQFVETAKVQKKSAYTKGYFSTKSTSGSEKRYEMSLSLRPGPAEEIWLSCLGRPLDAELLLRQLHGTNKK